ncbi:MAG: hypothetical protein BroJett040_18140 [Oligoflexia bacterium]|nr:MAG: hypothetical protein BroJett040_18140 [Oligoflexia bacterium]
MTRYRTVTRYRKELRTREVVRYREEQRCCVTRYRDVFDHQWTLSVQIHFPQNSQLLEGERESVQVELIGNEAKPEVRLNWMDSKFLYTIENQVESTGRMDVYLKAEPKPVIIDEGVLKNESLISAVMRGERDSSVVGLIDQSPDAISVRTEYTITVAQRNSSGRTTSLGEKTFKRADLIRSPEGSYKIPVNQIVKTSAGLSGLRRGERVLVVVEVRRTTTDGKKIQFWKDNWVTVE